MATTPSTALYAIEKQALQVLDREMQRYLEGNQPPTPALVQLLKNTHEMVMKRLKNSLGEMGESNDPRAMLVRCVQFESELRQLIDLNERAEQLDS